MPRIVIPFASGAREDVDPRVMPEGALKRAENLRLRRDGRLGVRYGYTALSLLDADSYDIVSYDITSFNGRLIAFASPPGYSTPNDIHEYVNQPQFAWRGTDSNSDTRLCPITSVRDTGRVPSQGISTTICDVAACGGLVCMVWQASATSSAIHIFNPTTDVTLTCFVAAGVTKPRVVTVGSVFFILGVEGTKVTLRRFNPATDNGTANLTDAFGTGDPILVLDAATNEAGTGFAVALARDTPTVTLKLFDSTGTATQTITGPAVTLERMAVFQQAARIHLAACEADDELDLYTYALPGGALENSTLNIGDMGGGQLAERQPGICVANGSTELLITYGELDTSSPIDHRTYFMRVAPATHVVGVYREWEHCLIATKPVAVPDSEMVGVAILDTETTGCNSLGLIGIAVNRPTEMLAVTVDPSTATVGNGNHLPSIAKDASTGKFYWIRLSTNLDSLVVTPVVSEVEFSSGRRQCAFIDNQLYIAGGVPQIFDSRQVFEAGFLDRPRIVSAAPSNGGSLQVSSLYLVCATYEWVDSQGRFHTSEPSDVVEVELGGTENSIVVNVTTPHSQRCNNNNEFYGSSVRVVVWRSLAAPDKQLLRDVTEIVEPVTDGWGRGVTVDLVQSDDALADEAVIYTQGSSGARSGPNPFVSPLPCKYLWASADRLLSGGLPVSSQVQESRAAFPNEPITWAQNLGGIGSAPERVLGVARLDERRIVFTANGILEFTGEGLDINGVGDIGSPRRLPSPGGLYGGAEGWRSLVETHVGIYFQLAADSIFLLPRGGGAPVFVGRPVRDTLASFPTITSATYLKTEQLVCFTCNNLAGSDSVILVHDLDHNQWFVDTDTTGLTSSCEYQGRLVILRASGAIELQNTTHPASTFIQTLVETGTIYPFGQGGQGQIDEIQFYGEFRGNCTLTPYLSFDDGKTYATLTAKSLSAAGSPAYVVGDTVALKWGPQRMRGDRVRLKFECTALAGAATEGIVYNYAAIDFTAAGRSALRDTNQKG